MNSEKLTADFSFEMPEGRDVTSWHVFMAATDLMRKDPFFQQRRKDGGLYKYSQMASCLCWGSPDAVLCGLTKYWTVIITPVGGRRFDVRAFNTKAVIKGCCHSFRALEQQAA